MSLDRGYSFLRDLGGRRVSLAIYLAPRSSRLALLGSYDGCLKVAVTAAPVANEANKQLISLVSKTFKCPKGAIRIEQGHTSRRKLLLLEGVSFEEASRLLDELPRSA